ncbi:MAG: hypothetical protein IJ133_01445, partial [Clostridia bacterium]|nr:hypothetical protein [Clostridia bacterium]
MDKIKSLNNTQLSTANLLVSVSALVFAILCTINCSGSEYHWQTFIGMDEGVKIAGFIFVLLFFLIAAVGGIALEVACIVLISQKSGLRSVLYHTIGMFFEVLFVLIGISYLNPTAQIMSGSYYGSSVTGGVAITLIVFCVLNIIMSIVFLSEAQSGIVDYGKFTPFGLANLAQNNAEVARQCAAQNAAAAQAQQAAYQQQQAAAAAAQA